MTAATPPRGGRLHAQDPAMSLRPLALALLVCAASAAAPARAFEVDLVPQNPRAIQLRVGSAGTLVDTVEVNLSLGNIGNGVAQAMTPTSGGGASSQLDGGPACGPGQVYIAGLYRTASSGQPFGDPARLSVVSPPSLVGPNGSIPISQIRWTTVHARSATSPVPASGGFTGGSQSFGSIPRNRWFETCMAFTYANTQIVPGGSYEGTVTFTLAQP